MEQRDWEEIIERVGIVAACVIKNDRKYLLVQEKQPKVYGLWNLPAGYVDKGETIEQAAVREAKEESGYQVTLGQKVGVYHESVGKPVKHAFTAQVVGGKLNPNPDEILDAKWLSLKEIRNLNHEDKLRADWIWMAISRAEELELG